MARKGGPAPGTKFPARTGPIENRGTLSRASRAGNARVPLTNAASRGARLTRADPTPSLLARFGQGADTQPSPSHAMPAA